MPQPGRSAPDFALPDDQGETRSLSQYRGRWVLLYFYPRDDTPGCTLEACGIRDVWREFEKAGIQVLGVSIDSVSRHDKFRQKYGLPFPLLSDGEKQAVELYGVWALKKSMGREYMGTRRTSFLIDPEGRVAKVYSQVKPEEHAGEVLADWAKLSA